MFLSFIIVDITGVGAINKVVLMNFNVAFLLSLVFCFHPPDASLCHIPSNGQEKKLKIIKITNDFDGKTIINNCKKGKKKLV